MHIIASSPTTRNLPLAAIDPFEDDADAPALPVRHAGLLRMAIVAAGVGARFQREGREEDPVAWMLSPRRMFDGHCGITACLDRTGFGRALVLNAEGMGFGLDADPEILDDLMDDDEDDVALEAEGSTAASRAAMPRHDPPVPPRAAKRRKRRVATSEDGVRLYTASFVRYDGGGRVMVFVGAVVDSERTFRNRVFERFGAIAALGADVREGFDQYDRIASLVVSDCAAERLALLAAEPFEETAEGFDVLAEQRA